MGTVLVTGSAGFIGSSLVIELLSRGDKVIGIDNHNSYYDPNLKNERVKRFINHPSYIHVTGDISNKDHLSNVFEKYEPSHVVNLAAQAGVRYSIENPHAYIESNLVGFGYILELCRQNKIEHLVYASSSSVYGANEKIPFSVNDNVDHPISLYAATKKCNELMAHSYSSLFGLPTTGLRFFTVYGPWGRPDMALFRFTKAILEGRKIQVFNYGRHRRDWTYIDDIVSGIIKILDRPASSDPLWTGSQPNPGTSKAPWRVYNIGNNSPTELNDFINCIEEMLGITADKEFLPLQDGDVPDTFADVENLRAEFGFSPSTPLKTGIRNFIDWYRHYYEV